MIFLRHPKPKVAPGTCYGRLDVGLTESAAAEIASAIRRLPPLKTVVTSPAQRCTRLAEAAARFLNARLSADARLWELDFGAWEGLAWQRINRAESDPWSADPWNISPPGGETFNALHQRVADALADLPDNALVVTHAGVIRAARMILLGESFAEVFARKIAYAEPIRLARGRR